MVTKLCSLDQFKHRKNKADALLSDDRSHIIIKQQANIFVYRNSCPHLDKRLSEQSLTVLDTGQDFIHCARHNALFTISQGLCIKGPCNGQKLKQVAYIVRDNTIFTSKACE